MEETEVYIEHWLSGDLELSTEMLGATEIGLVS